MSLAIQLDAVGGVAGPPPELGFSSHTDRKTVSPSFSMATAYASAMNSWVSGVTW
jgi:hypothetical protein